MSFPQASRLLRSVMAVAVAAILAACSTTGKPFDTTDLRFLVPGETTLQEAQQLLQGDPVNIYRQNDGSAIARWAHTSTVLTDAIYVNRELWLAFDAYGRFERIVKSYNVGHANLYQDGRRVDIPPPAASYPANPAALHGQHAPAAAPAAASSYSTPAVPAEPSPFSRSTVAYPIGK